MLTKKTASISAPAKKLPKEKGTPHPLQEALYFITRFLAKPHSVGSIWPSSRYLGAAMLDEIELKKGDVVLEYGPGTGPFTKLLRSYLPQGIEYLGIEHDRKLCKGLQKRFPEMRFHHGSAEDAALLLKKYNLKPASLVISGLPFANMPASLQEKILEATTEALDTEGVFRTFTYLLSSISPRTLHFKKMVIAHFSEHHSCKKVFWNIPPARVLSFSHPVKN